MACTSREAGLKSVCDIGGEWGAFRIMLDQKTAMGSEHQCQKVRGAVFMC